MTEDMHISDEAHDLLNVRLVQSSFPSHVQRFEDESDGTHHRAT